MFLYFYHLDPHSPVMQVICTDMELKIQPYEWVYDGLKPLFLDSIFDVRKGIHISLAALYCAVGRRLECPILPELASRARMLSPSSFPPLLFVQLGRASEHALLPELSRQY